MFEDGIRPEQHWTIKSALVGSIVHGGHRYAANEGEWYRVEQQFRASIEQAFSSLVRDWNGDKPSPLKRIYDGRGNGHFESEENYNIRMCKDRGYVLADRNLIRIHNSQAGGFEACDALDIAGKRFIHVKRSSRRSSILSHFFKQGSNSAQQFKRFEAAWGALAELVEKNGGAQVKAELLRAKDNLERKWRVEFWIIDVPRANGEFNIPFFSKISLRDEANKLQAMDYEVCVRFIRMQPEPV